MKPPEKPKGFRQVNKGDRWIEFAYIKDEIDCEHCSLITGFYECTREMWFGKIPRGSINLKDFADWDWDQKAWMIEGKKYSKQPKYPVNVPSINELLGRTVVGPTTLVRISREEFEHIQNETFKRELNPQKIPLLGRDPVNEQEVLSIVIGGHKKLGIEKIMEVQSHFPDMLVKVGDVELYLELEVRSLDFRSHGHIKDLRRLSKGKHEGKREAKLRKDKDDDRPVAVLCWENNDKDRELNNLVPDLKVFEIKTLIREKGRKIAL